MTSCTSLIGTNITLLLGYYLLSCDEMHNSRYEITIHVITIQALYSGLRFAVKQNQNYETPSPYTYSSHSTFSPVQC